MSIDRLIILALRFIYSIERVKHVFVSLLKDDIFWKDVILFYLYYYLSVIFTVWH